MKVKTIKKGNDNFPSEYNLLDNLLDYALSDKVGFRADSTTILKLKELLENGNNMIIRAVLDCYIVAKLKTDTTDKTYTFFLFSVFNDSFDYKILSRKSITSSNQNISNTSISGLEIEREEVEIFKNYYKEEEEREEIEELPDLSEWSEGFNFK
jgi:hypothetical protein